MTRDFIGRPRGAASPGADPAVLLVCSGVNRASSSLNLRAFLIPLEQLSAVSFVRSGVNRASLALSLRGLSLRYICVDNLGCPRHLRPCRQESPAQTALRRASRRWVSRSSSTSLSTSFSFQSVSILLKKRETCPYPSGRHCCARVISKTGRRRRRRSWCRPTHRRQRL